MMRERRIKMLWVGIIALLMATLAVPIIPSPSARADGNTMTVVAPTAKLEIGDEFDVSINLSISSPSGCAGAQCALGYNPNVLECLSVKEGNFFKDWANSHGLTSMMLPKGTIDNTQGRVSTTAVFLVGVSGSDAAIGSGTFLTYTFKAKGNGISPIELIAADRYISDFTGSELAGSTYVSGQVVVGDAGVPIVSTGVATTIGDLGATLNGTLSEIGSTASVSVSFEWGLNASYGRETMAKVMSAPGDFQAELTGLLPGTTYHYRAKAVGSIAVYGEDETFVTTMLSGTPPVVVTGNATAVGQKGATLNGILEVTGSGTPVQVYFEWGTSADYGMFTPAFPMVTSGSFSYTIAEGLTPGTTYHYRAKAVGYGIAYGQDKTFHTEGGDGDGSVTLAARIIPKIALTVSPSKIDFGDLAPGDMPTTAVTITNRGFVPIDVMSEVLGDDLFVEGIVLDSKRPGEWNTHIPRGSEKQASLILAVPIDVQIGSYQGKLIFWAKAASATPSLTP